MMQSGAANRADAILLVNLGTPDAPTPAAVRRYLAEFLSDPRVVELPRLLWLPILHGLVLRLRPARSAEKYAAVWTPQGSPLAVHTARQAEQLAARLASVPGAEGLRVAYAMRYGDAAHRRRRGAAGRRRPSNAASSCRCIRSTRAAPRSACATCSKHCAGTGAPRCQRSKWSRTSTCTRPTSPPSQPACGGTGRRMDRARSC